MEDSLLAAWSFISLLVIIFLRVPIGVSMLLMGVGGSWIIFGDIEPLLRQLQNLAYGQFSSHSLSIIPLFLLMGQFASYGGMSKSLFKAAESFIGHTRGGTAMAAIGACVGFGSICGSSMATAATMSQAALPELRRSGYSNSLSVGVLAAGGTLGILIPPSVVLVIYALLTEQNIAKMFAAAFTPGLLAALGYVLVVVFISYIKPELVGRALDKLPFLTRLKALVKVWPILLIFLAVVGGIYTGIFTPTEGAAVGAAGTGLLAFFTGNLKWTDLKKIFEGTASSTAMIYMIILGAASYNTFLALSMLPQELAMWVGDLNLSPYQILWTVLVFYIVLGCVMDSMSMILLTIPIFFPLVSGLDFSLTSEETAIWFGILVLVTAEVGLITPPVGMNLFVIQAIAKDISIKEAYIGAFPFVISDLIRILILVLFPSISLFILRF